MSEPANIVVAETCENPQPAKIDIEKPACVPQKLHNPIELTGITSLNHETEYISSATHVGIAQYHKILAEYVGATEMEPKKYVKLDVLGCGLYGKVYGCKTDMKEYVAMKKSGIDHGNIAVDILNYREVLTMKSIPEHPGICKFISAHFTSNKLYIIMEWCAGKNLQTEKYVIDKMSVAKMMMSAIRHLHVHKIVHLDANLGNFVYDSKKRAVKLVDFGTCRKIDGTERVERKMVCGREYKCPKIRNCTDIDESGKKIKRQIITGDILYCADAWALGISILRISTGVNYSYYPVGVDSKKIDFGFPDVPVEIATILKSLLSCENPVIPMEVI